jgi:glycosyltransferase involved in cell wall biosynthesis
VITDLEVGGVPLHLLRLAAHVRRSGWAVGVVSLKAPGPVGDRLADAGVEVLSCDARGAADARVFVRLAAVIQRFSPDLVHALLFHANVASRVACVLVGFPARRLLCEIQTVEIERTWHLAVDRFTHRRCRFTIGNSPSVLRHLHARARIPMARLRLAPGGVDVAAIEAARPMDREALGVRPNEKLLLWVGRMDPIKGLDTLVAAVDLARRAVPLRLLLVGDGDIKRHIEADVAARGLGELVSLLGRRDDVPRLLQTADLFVFPSRTEGMPNALLEAMAAGLPVVTTDVPGCHDVVTAGETGRLVPPDDAEALAAAIAEAFEEADLTEVMRQAARRLVEGRYRLERCMARYLELYDEAQS